LKSSRVEEFKSSRVEELKEADLTQRKSAEGTEKRKKNAHPENEGCGTHGEESRRAS
jgi:hypothetical protein